MSAIASTRKDAEAKNAPTSGRLFFLDLGAGRILSANPDGSDLKTIINEGRKLPDGLVLLHVGSGIPILFPGARISRGNQGAGWPAYVHQRRSPGREPNGAALRRGDCRTASPAARLELRRLCADRQGQGGRDLGPERKEDRRRYMRIHQCGAQLLHAGAPGLSGQTGHSTRGLPGGSQASFRGSQPARDASLRQKH